MKNYEIILSENNSYAVKADRLRIDGVFSVLLDKDSIVAVIPSSACVICLGDVNP
jgi:hypothetical protein